MFDLPGGGSGGLTHHWLRTTHSPVEQNFDLEVAFDPPARPKPRRHGAVFIPFSNDPISYSGPIVFFVIALTPESHLLYWAYSRQF